jgi:hypothetical protein
VDPPAFFISTTGLSNQSRCVFVPGAEIERISQRQ